jgi:transcription elongation factor GreA
MTEIVLTREGLLRLERELEQLKTARRREVAELLKEAFASAVSSLAPRWTA